MRKKILHAVLFLPMFVCGQWQYLGNPNFIDGNITFRTMIPKNSVLFYIYDGGFVEKRIIFD